MPRMPEPCLCGAPDCPRCFPSTYKDYALHGQYEIYCEMSNAEGGPTMEYNEWLSEREDREAYLEELAWEKKHDR